MRTLTLHTNLLTLLVNQVDASAFSHKSITRRVFYYIMVYAGMLSKSITRLIKKHLSQYLQLHTKNLGNAENLQPSLTYPEEDQKYVSVYEGNFEIIGY